MVLSETGESRVNGYLFVLERSLKSFLPRETVVDAVREIESHVRERIASVQAGGDERAALERILAELGPPLRVAQAYSAERTLDEAVTTGRIVPMVRAIWQLAFTTATGFFAGLGLLVSYAIGVALVAVAAMKPVFPANVGFFIPDDGRWDFSLGALFPVPAGRHDVAGYAIIPVCLVAGLAVLVAAHRAARRFLGWMRRPRLAHAAVS